MAKTVLLRDTEADPQQEFVALTLAEVLANGNDPGGRELVVSAPAPSEPAIATITLSSTDAEANADRMVTAQTSGDASAKTRATANDGDADVSAVALTDNLGEADATTLAQSGTRKVGMTAVATAGVGVLGFYDGGVDGEPAGTGALGTMMLAAGDGSSFWGQLAASNVTFDASGGDLSSTDVQGAIAELVARVMALEAL